MKYTPSTLAAILMAAGVVFDVEPANAQVTRASVRVDRADTALVVVDPRVDFLSAKGATWKLVGKSVEANHTVENLEALFTAAKANDIPVFISPHCYYPWDHKWDSSGGPANAVMITGEVT